MLAFDFRMIYEIIDIYIEVDNFCNEIWELFRAKDVKKESNCIVKINKIYREIHGIICESVEVGAFQLARIGEDVLLVDKEWKRAQIMLPRDTEKIEIFLLQIFYSLAVKKNIIQLHSSLISHQNQGIMFLGPSGIGKTTQAELWQKYRSSLIINGDIVFVQETDSGFLGWGTPWHGSSPYCENTSVPLKAMVVLKQSDQNSIRELTGFEKVTEVSNSVFYPQWLENGMELCLETLDHLLTSIPVYELRCRPDEDAVRLTEQTIFS